VIAADLICLRKMANSAVSRARWASKAYILLAETSHHTQQGMITVQDFPHRYHISASAETEGNILLKAENLPQLVSAPPAEFGGPGDQWSPEHLLVASVADCFILTFRAVARASKLDWSKLEASAEGVLDRVDRVTQFTAITVRADLTVPAGTDIEKARRLLQKSEESCLVTNSLKASTHLEANVIAED
jgi:peroxiredoxin-like protein